MRTPHHKDLTRKKVLAAALEVVDREGLGALSMRRVGEVLGVEAMSLYNHVANKAVMLDGLFEVVLDELPPSPRTRSWVAALRERAHALRDVLRAHPQALALFATRPAVTEASLAHVESLLTALRRGGFRVDDALSVMQVLLAWVVGHTAATHGPPAADLSPPRYERLDADRFPRVREAARALARHDVDHEFALGLDALLAGLELRLRPRPRG